MTEMVPAWINGKLQPVEKIEVHKRALRHKAVSVFIMVGTETLLQKRALNKYHCPGLWANACCTHPHWDEASETCARRRIKEELGISTTLPLLYRNQVEYRADVGNDLTEHELVDIFLIRVEKKSDLGLKLNQDEVMSTRWIDMDLLDQEITSKPNTFTPWLRIYLKDHYNQILSF